MMAYQISVSCAAMRVTTLACILISLNVSLDHDYFRLKWIMLYKNIFLDNENHFRLLCHAESGSILSPGVLEPIWVVLTWYYCRAQQSSTQLKLSFVLFSFSPANHQPTHPATHPAGYLAIPPPRKL